MEKDIINEDLRKCRSYITEENIEGKSGWEKVDMICWQLWWWEGIMIRWRMEQDTQRVEYTTVELVLEQCHLWW